jgi:hypothetical protein
MLRTSLLERSGLQRRREDDRGKNRDLLDE